MGKSYYLFEQAEDGAYKQHDLETTVGEDLVDYYKWEHERRQRQANLQDDPSAKSTVTREQLERAFNMRFKIYDVAQGTDHEGFLRNKYFKFTDNAPENIFRTSSREEVQDIYDEYRALQNHILKIPEHERTKHYDANAVANGMIMASKVVAIRKGYKQPLAFGYCWLENSQKKVIDDPSAKNVVYNWFIDDNDTIWFVDAVKGVDTRNWGEKDEQSGCTNFVPKAENGEAPNKAV